MSKYAIIITIVSFWLFFPLVMSLAFQDYSFIELDKYNTVVQQKTGITTILPSFLNFIFDNLAMYFKLATLTLPNVWIGFKFFVWILQTLSILIIILIVRGDS